MRIVSTIIAGTVGALGGAACSFIGTGLSFLLAWFWVIWQHPGYTIDYPTALMASMAFWSGAACAVSMIILESLCKHWSFAPPSLR